MKKILEYQKLDTELYKMEREINKSEHKKSAQDMASFIRDSQSKIINLDKQSRILYDEIDKLKVVEQKGLGLVEKYSKQYNNDMKEEELGELKARVTQTLSQLKELENRLLSSNQKSKQLLQEFDTTKKKMNIAKSKHQESKEKFEDFYASKTPELKTIKEKLEKLEKELDGNFIAKYKALKQDGIFPVVVPLVDKRCGGCRMELPANEFEKIKVKGSLECPSCRRFIYIQEKKD